VCKRYHGRLHKRFNNPLTCAAYKAHIKRGGYGADLADPKIARQIKLHADALARGRQAELLALRPFAAMDLWWDLLNVDPASLTSPSARPR
jgi:hypothetical protein